MFKKTAIILAALTLSVVAASAATIADTDYIIHGDKKFSQFSVVGASASEIGISTFDFNGGSVVGITFTTPFSITTGTADYTLKYKVEVITGNDVIYQIGQSMSAFAGPGPFSQAKLDEFAYDVSFVSGYNGNSTIQWNYPSTNPNNDPEDPDAEPSDLLTLLRPGQELWITKDIYLNAGCVGPNGPVADCQPGGASATTINQYFFQRDGGDVPGVPEPATMLLFSTALLGLGFMRRKKS